VLGRGFGVRFQLGLLTREKTQGGHFKKPPNVEAIKNVPKKISRSGTKKARSPRKTEKTELIERNVGSFEGNRGCPTVADRGTSCRLEKKKKV